MRNVPSLETVYRDYSKKGIQFFYIYKALAHPERDGYVQPVTLKERLTHVETAKAQLETGIPWICDSMTNDIKHALGDRPNSEFVIDPDGKILHARSWSDPDQLRKDLTALAGAVEPPTKIADLDRKKPARKKRAAASGVVDRVPRPEGSQPLIHTAHVDPDNDTPFYAKLRVEAERQVISNGSGKIHIGFHLDPIYSVHWNNLARPLEFELIVPHGSVTPATGKAPKVEVESDVDPREFLVEAEGLEERDSITLTVRYFACNDEEGWCKPVTQSYSIALERDRDAGRVALGRGGSRGPAEMLERLKRSDSNEDGKISRSEFRGPDRMFGRIDRDKDGELSKDEITAMSERIGSRGPGGRERRPSSD